MAITYAGNVVRFGATLDQYKVPMDTVNGSVANDFHGFAEGAVLCCGVNPGTVKLTELADGSGSSIYEAILKSNVSIFIEGDVTFRGGLKLTAPAGAFATVFLDTD